MHIHTVDLQYLDIPQAIAGYVVVGSQGPVLIEAGPASTLDHLRTGVRSLGFELDDIRHALVTHIHLDHAGAAGHLAKRGTKIYVHEFGAKHLVDPSKLIDSATRIYGNQMDRLWGQLLPVPEKQIEPVRDGDIIDIEGLRFTAIETPGHARHHHAFAIGDVCFVGDIAGISVPGVPEPPVGKFISVPTPPPEFDLAAWHTSIDRLNARQFDTIYLTHFGPRHNPPGHFRRLHELIDEHANFIARELKRGLARDEILCRYIEWNRNEAQADHISDDDFARYVSTNLLTMNVDGMIRYWNKLASAAASR